jgi:hypothetical protein
VYIPNKNKQKNQMLTTNNDQQINLIVDELNVQARKAGRAINLAAGYQWVAKRIHRFKDVQEACEYYMEQA